MDRFETHHRKLLVGTSLTVTVTSPCSKSAQVSPLWSADLEVMVEEVSFPGDISVPPCFPGAQSVKDHILKEVDTELELNACGSS